MQLRPDELIRTIRLPRSTKTRHHYFRKVGTRRAQAISKVCLVAVAAVEGGAIRDIRIALGSVAPTVIRCTKTEATLRNRPRGQQRVEAAKAELMNEIAPIDDMRSTAQYRSLVAANLLQEFLRECG
jgi:CO/xanthine dehydrogenase FAD-binding subunit